MILFFTSPIGLGHVTRDFAIMNKIIELFDYNNFGFITGSLAFDFLCEENIKTFNKKLFISNLYNPPKFKIDKGELHHNTLWLINYLFYYYLSKGKLRHLFASHSNHLNHPFFDMLVSDEDFASLSLAKKLPVGKKRILITDVLSTSFSKSLLSMQFEKYLNKSMNELIRSSDCVIIPEFGDSKDNYFFVGPIVREINDTRDNLRKKFSLTKKTILVTTGGTKAGQFLIKKTIESLQKLKNHKEYDLVISFPYDIEVSNSQYPYKNLGFVKNINEYIFASDLVISLAGKSTIDECQEYDIPGIFIPIKNHFEQEERAHSLGFTFNDINKLDSLIEEKLTGYSVGNYSRKSEDNGASKSAKLIYSFLNN